MSGEWIHVKRLGGGGYGDIHLYTLGTMCRAVKFFKGSFNCWSEIDKMKKLKHENIVEAFNTPSNFKELVPVLFMEYSDRGSLRDEMKRCRYVFDELAVRTIIRHIAKGLKFLHDSGITHRDLKPENILVFHVSNINVYKITDFGMAKEATDNESLVSVGVGTPAYWAPEQFDNYCNHKERITSHKRTVDYWALGLICHEVITGIRPYYISNDVHSKEFRERFEMLREVKSSSPADDIICYTPGLKGEYVKSNTIAFPNCLCRTSLAVFSKFLQVMLRYNKETRGESSTVWSSYVNKITTCYMLIIYSVPTQTIFSYPNNQKNEASFTVRIIIEAISQEAGLPRDKLVLMQWKNGEGTFLKPSALMKDYLCKFESPEEVEEGCLLLMLHNYRGELPCTRSNQEECKELLEVARNPHLLSDRQKEWYKVCASFYNERNKTHCRRLTRGLSGMAAYKKNKLPRLQELKLKLEKLFIEYENGIVKYAGLAEELLLRGDVRHGVIQEKVDEWRKINEEHMGILRKVDDSVLQLQQCTSQWWTLPNEDVSIWEKIKATNNMELVSAEILAAYQRFEGFVTIVNEKMRFIVAILLPDDVERYIKLVAQRLRKKQTDDPFELLKKFAELKVPPI